MTSPPSPKNPTDLLTDELVAEALRNDKGPGCKIISWKTKDFTKKGDNYSSFVTSIPINYKQYGETKEKSYIAKLNPLRPESGLTLLLETMYGREATVLESVVPGMNEKLANLGLPVNPTAKHFAKDLKKGEELIIMSDLRPEGFMMHDRRKGLDVDHAVLVMEALGTFHASSFLFEETLPNKSIPDNFPYFEEPWQDESSPVFKLFHTMIGGQMANAAQLLTNEPKFEKCVKWLNSFQEASSSTYFDAFQDPKNNFSYLCHGDCWTNNILFKYDDSGKPIDIRLVDLQGARKGSLVCDLNYFMFSSLNGDTRWDNKKLLAVTYYLSFAKVFLTAGKELPFTLKLLQLVYVNLFTSACVHQLGNARNNVSLCTSAWESWKIRELVIELEGLSSHGVYEF